MNYIHTWDKPCNITAHSSAFINPHFSKALAYALLPWKKILKTEKDTHNWFYNEITFYKTIAYEIVHYIHLIYVHLEMQHIKYLNSKKSKSESKQYTAKTAYNKAQGSIKLIVHIKVLL